MNRITDIFHTAKPLKPVCSFFNIMDERVKGNLP